MHNVLCIIQARMGSTRLPGKILMEAGGIPLLEYMVRRVRLAKNIAKIVIATSDEKSDDPTEALCGKIGVDCFRGSLDDVLDRYSQCARAYTDHDTIMRLTGDCPLIDPVLIDAFASRFNEDDYDYLGPSAALGEETFPEGLAEIEIFTREALQRAAENAKKLSEREHVTLFFASNTDQFKKGFMSLPDKSLAPYRLTVDNLEDYEVVKFVIENSDITDGYQKHIALLKKYPDIAQKNMFIERNEGLQKSLKKEKAAFSDEGN